MEIVLSGFDLDSSIDAYWEKIKNQSKGHEHLKDKVSAIYLEDFKNDLNFALNEQLQTALDLSFHSNEFDIQSATCNFTYLQSSFILSRIWIDGILYWKVYSTPSSELLCLTHELEQRLVLELAKIKHSKNL